MTTVVWDGKTLAADRQLTSDEVVRGGCSKIFNYKKDKYLSGCGCYYEITATAEYFKDIEKNDKPSIEESEFILLDTKQKRVWMLDKRLIPITVDSPFAIGSGSHFALAALTMGLDAVSAIRLASKLDINTGGGIEFITIDGEYGKLKE